MARNFIFLTTLMLLFSGVGCSFQKILKDGTPEEKLIAAKKYYNKEDYTRAMPLLEDLLTVYRRKPEAEEIYYYYSYTYYGMGDFTMAAHNFKNFTENYPRSTFTEEAAFMSAKCFYHQTYAFNLDQTNTRTAIDKIQLFINTYPKSPYVAEGNKLIDELRGKLHKKAYSNAMLYYKMANYKSAIVAFRNAISDYPDLPEKQQLEFLIVKATYEYAQQSFLSSQAERYADVIEEGELFLQGENTEASNREAVIKMMDEARKKNKQLSIDTATERKS